MLIAQLSDLHIKLPGRLAYKKVDTATMLAEAHAGILFHAPENVIREFPQFPAVHTFDDLKREFIKASNRELSL